VIFPTDNFWTRSELFSDDSPLTWQVRTCNPITLLAELSETLDLAEQFDAARYSIAVLVAELKFISKLDPIINHKYKNIADFIQSLSEGEIKLDQIPYLTSQIKVLRDKLAPYRHTLISELREVLATSSSKDRCSSLTTALATELTAEGYSVSHLREGLKILIDPEEKDFCTRYDALITYCSGKTRPFKCRFGAGLPTYIDGEALAHVGIEVSIGTPIGPQTLTEVPFYRNANEADVYADVSVFALDPYAAQRIAEQKLSNLFAIRQIYQVLKTAQKKRLITLVTDINASRTIQVRTEKSRLTDWNMNETEISKHFQLQARLSSEDADQLAAAAQYHRLAMIAPTDEARIVNLWIALESLARRGGSSIIENVCANVSPNVSTAKIPTLIEGLRGYLSFPWKRCCTKELMAIFPNSTSEMISSIDILDGLLDEDKGPKAVALYQLAQDHPLLLYRIFRLRTDGFISAKAVAASLRRHRSNIDWQLRRIFRSRNAIAHQGRGALAIRFLFHHLHTYFITTIHHIINDLHANPAWSIPDTLTHRRMIFDQLLRSLDQDRKIQISRSSLIDPMTVIRPFASAAPAWPTREGT
jgi:hypothetical protein